MPLNVPQEGFKGHQARNMHREHAMGNVNMVQEIKNRLKEALHETFHRGILEGVRNMSHTLENNGIKFLVWGKIQYF